MPIAGADCMSDVPTLGLPNIRRSFGRSGNPTAAAPRSCGICAKTVMPLAFTSASSRLIVSLGPKLLLIVVSPSAAMAFAPDRNIAAINASILRKMVIAYFPRAGLCVAWLGSHRRRVRQQPSLHHQAQRGEHGDAVAMFAPTSDKVRGTAVHGEVSDGVRS